MGLALRLKARVSRTFSVDFNLKIQQFNDEHLHPKPPSLSLCTPGKSMMNFHEKKKNISTSTYHEEFNENPKFFSAEKSSVFKCLVIIEH